VTRRIQFVPPFPEIELDKYFLHFEKIATTLNWPSKAWTLLLQKTLVGKVPEVYSDCLLTRVLYTTQLREAYELAPQAYCQKFRSTKRGEMQTCVEFA